MKNRIVEIIELGQPQSIIQRENQPITELIKTDSLMKELNQQLFLYGVMPSYFQVVQETRKLGLQEVTSGLKTLDQAKKAMKENEQWFDNMHIIAKIDN